MAGRQPSYRSKFGPRFLAALFCFSVVFVLSYISTNVGRHRQFPHSAANCPSGLFSTTKHTKLHILLLSYPRSGSSFLGDLLQSYNGAFYHFEPLHYFGSVVASSQTPEARKLVHDLFKCDYRDWTSFPEWAWFNSDFLTLRRNKHYWQACSHKDRTRLQCYNVCYLAEACRASPVQIIKTIRMEASEVGNILEEYDDLNLKVIHLVRDPRGTMNSRQQKDIAVWCGKYEACSSPNTFCSLVDDDLKHACRLQRRYPGKYTVLRYEDLALDPPETTKKLFEFLGLGDVPREVSHFLDTHTQGNVHLASNSFLQPPYRTARNSTQAALEWCRKLKLTSILKIQRSCHSILDQLGYKMVYNKTDLKAEDVMEENSRFCLPQ